MADVLQILGATGDAAVIAVFFLMWKLDRRLVRIETHLFDGKKK